MAVNTQLQVRRGTASQWTSTNPTLAAGEFGFETDTGKFKIGNGSTAWTSLSYATMSASTADTLTNKTISGSSNTLSNIGNSSLTNSSITINGSSVSLGGSVTITGESFHPFLLMGT
jgi:nanoRNase/pAp phosphatase (c-di-AMP/oligoRNAs hydrolase)